MTGIAEKPLTRNMRPDGSALDLPAYQKAGGYQAIRRILNGGMTPKAVTEEVKAANLRGRGGAGFPTGLKWSFVPVGKDAPNPTYMVVNADEMEPGTFKDRLLLERDPHQVIEGAIIAAFAIEADFSYIFLRGEYTLAAERIARAIAESYERNYLGKNILGSGFSLDLHLHVSGGRYICGDETGLLNALEGKRANPRAKPPFPVVVGLFGKPTVVNNVETLSCVPHIIDHGAPWFRDLGRGKDAGTKLYGVSGKVKRPGLWELPMGTTAREILEEHAGGMKDGVKFRGLLPGGSSTPFIVEQHLDTPMNFTEMPKAGSRLGTGTMIVLDDHTCPVGMTWNMMRFFGRESCGFCTPCWSGLGWVERILKSMEDGQGKPGDLERLASQANMWNPGNTFCALAPGAADPLQTALKYFRDDFERHIRQHRCPWR
ncbi:MAG TPA: NADH-quinone oxidoreductase subunit NuoF [Candidatus Acidoferrales bacterium]|nr:NADH-quinone oxidoreductase subunit NuoF [Candidatus Acidoferrales bacterium]